VTQIDAYPHNPWPGRMDDTVSVTAPPMRFAWMMYQIHPVAPNERKRREHPWHGVLCNARAGRGCVGRLVAEAKRRRR